MAMSNLKANLAMECKPKLLKDFLNDDSRNDFGSYPSKPFTKTVQNQQFIVLRRSKSRTTSSTILAIHKASEIAIKTIKYFPFASLKSPSFFPSISRKHSSGVRRKDHDDYQREVTTAKVKVKDILRWRSSRDLVEEESTPLDLLYSPSRCTSGSTACTSPLTNKSSSWCDSDFSAEDFPSWCYASDNGFGENEIKMPKNNKRFSPLNHVGEDFLEKTMDEAEEQYTPVSVLASPFQEDEEKQVDEVEENAKKLLHHVRGTMLPNCYNSFMEDNLLMDFFWEELSKDHNDELLERELLASSQDWLRGVHVENHRENYVKEMEKGVRWNKHEEEKEEMSLQLEKVVLNNLVDEVLFDLYSL